MNRAQLFRLIRRGAGTPPLPAEVPYLVPGAGWGGVETETPPPNGTSGTKGYSTAPQGRICGNAPFVDLTADEEITLRWHIRHRPTAAEFASGMVSNVTKVEASVEDGLWFELPRVLDEQSGLECYTAKLRLSDFTAIGTLHEVRVRAHVSNGHNRVWQGDIDGPFAGYFFTPNDGTLFAARRYLSQSTGSDSNDGLSPATAKLTMKAAKDSIWTASGNTTVGGGLIDIIDGTYPLGDGTENFGRSSGDRWLTIRRHPDSAPEDVLITGTPFSDAGLRVTKIRLKGLRLGGIATFATTEPLNARILCEDCDADGPGQQFGGDIPGALLGVTWKAAYWVGGTYKNYPSGLKSFNMVAYAQLESIGEDAFSNSLNVYGCSVKDINRGSHAGGPNAWHPDVAALPTAPTQNVMWYGITALENIYAEGLFGNNNSTATVDDLLIEDVQYARAGEAWIALSIARTSNNVTIINSDFGPGPIIFDDGKPPETTVTNHFNPTEMTLINVTSSGSVTGRDHSEVDILGGNI